jgi:hypothetical protein
VPSLTIVTDIFPPTPRVGIHRTVGLCRYLVERGWSVTVITTRPDPDDGADADLLKDVPPAVRVRRLPVWDVNAAASRTIARLKGSNGSAPAPKPNPADSHSEARDESQEARRPGLLRRGADWLSWWLHVPDRKAGWLPPAAAAAIGEAMRHRPDAVFSTAPLWTSHVVAGVVSEAFRVPWVADFRDPWRGSHWRHLPYASHRAADERLERWVVRRASRITCAWDGIRRHLSARYPWKADRIETIVNGFDPAQIDDVRPIETDTDRCVLIHTGTFYGPRSPEPLFAALERLADEHPDEADRLRIELVGSPEYGGAPLEELARRRGVDGLVRVRGSVPFAEAVGRVKGADVAMLFGQSGSKELASVPAKAFDYIGLSKPVLAVGAGDDAVELMRRGGCRVFRAEADRVGELTDRLCEIVEQYDRRALRGDDASARDRFRRSEMARRLAAAVNAVTANPVSF